MIGVQLRSAPRWVCKEAGVSAQMSGFPTRPGLGRRSPNPQAWGQGPSPSGFSRTRWDDRKWTRMIIWGRRREGTWASGAQLLSSVFISLCSVLHIRGERIMPPVQLSVRPGKYGRPLQKENCWSLFVLGWEGLLVNKYILIMQENWYANEGHHWQALDGRGRALHSCGLAWRSQGCAWPFVGCFLGVKTSFPDKSVKEGTGPGGDFRIFCLHTS